MRQEGSGIRSTAKVYGVGIEPGPQFCGPGSIPQFSKSGPGRLGVSRASPASLSSTGCRRPADGQALGRLIRTADPDRLPFSLFPAVRYFLCPGLLRDSSLPLFFALFLFDPVPRLHSSPISPVG